MARQKTRVVTRFRCHDSHNRIILTQRKTFCMVIKRYPTTVLGQTLTIVSLFLRLGSTTTAQGECWVCYSLLLSQLILSDVPSKCFNRKLLTPPLFLLQAMSIEGQDSIFGQENSVAATQNSSQPQLPEPENKMDDSIDNQQQVFVATHLFIIYWFSSTLTYSFFRIWIWMRALMEWRRTSLRQKKRRL